MTREWKTFIDFFFFFLTHNLTWADVQNLLNTLLTSEEHKMVLDKAREEADLLRAETPGNPVRAAARGATPKADPDGDVNAGDRPELY